MKPDDLSCQDFVRQEIEYYDRQAWKTHRAQSGFLRRMHAFYLGLARHRRLLLEALTDDQLDPERHSSN